MSTHIVPAQISHAPAISNMIHDMLDLFLVGSSKAAQTSFFNDYFSADALVPYLADELHDYYVMQSSHGDIIGVIGLYNARHIRHLFVARNYHGNGYARQLWNHAMPLMLSKNSTDKPFTVNSSVYAISTYRAFGFLGKEEDIRREHGIEYLPMYRAILQPL